jgi:hypothetical protein
MRLLLAILLVQHVEGTGHGQLGVDHSTEYLLRRIASSRPEHTDPTLDCSWRRLSYELAPQLQPLTAARSKELHDALELETMCNETFSTPVNDRPPPQSRRNSSITVFVSTSGHDAAAGSESAPLLTLQAAVARVKERRGALGTSGILATIYMRGGTYALNETLVLTTHDSHLTITPYPGKRSD